MNKEINQCDAKVIKEAYAHNGMLVQIIMTSEFGGRYYLVIDGEPGFHSLELERVENYMNEIL